jgi:hypothetical protein
MFTFCLYGAGRNDLMRTNPLQGPLEGLGPENQDFYGPEMATYEVSIILAQKSRDFLGPPLSMARVMDLPNRVHRVATAAFWRTFSDEGKISPGW